MQKYPHNINEFSYLAVALIYGERSPHIKLFNSYKFPVFQKEKGLNVVEATDMTADNHQEINRNLKIDDKRSVITSHTDMKSEINQTITYIDAEYKIHIGDTLFSDNEFEYFKQDWDKNIESKIKNLAIFIESIYKKEITDIPIFINEYPNITRVLLKDVDRWSS